MAGWKQNEEGWGELEAEESDLPTNDERDEEAGRMKDDSKASSLHPRKNRNAIICEECVSNESSRNQG